MIWLLRDIDLLSTLLRAANLSFEALLLGGIAYLLVVARPAKASSMVESICLRGIGWAALALALSEVVTVVLSGASLIGDSDLRLGDLLSAKFFQAGLSAALLALLLWACSRWKGSKGAAAMIPLSLLLLAAAVSTSHAAARMDDRWLLAMATAVHHLGTAAWIGAMPFLLVSLPRAESVEEARAMARRYSSMALLSVAVLVLAGVYMAWSYVGTWNGLYGTNYGVLLLAKIYLLLVILLMGSGNWLMVRRLNTDPQPLLAKLRRFAEAEIGLGFTVILAAASMSSQPPAVDVTDQVSRQVIVARMHPEAPRLKSPSVSQLTPPTSIETEVQVAEFHPTGWKRRDGQGMVGIQPPLGGFDRFGCGTASFCQPFSRHALGSLLAALLRGSVRFHSAACRPRELALRPTSVLGKLFFPRCTATPRSRGTHPVLCGVRVRGAGRQVTGSMGIHDFPRHVRFGGCGPAHS